MLAKNYRPASAGMLPALPGTYLVTAYFDDGQVELVKCNVIGWSVSTERTVVPLVMDPRVADEEPWHVIHPDGRVECSDGRGWADLDCWITEERRRRRESLEAHPLSSLVPDPAKPAEIYRPPVPQGMPAEPPPPQAVSGRPPSAPYATPVL
jgi:hypothetical protein